MKVFETVHSHTRERGLTMAKKAEEKISADVFLSRHQIPYSHFPGSPAEVVQALVTLNGMRTWDTESLMFAYTVYSTPDFVAVPTNPNTWSSKWITKEFAAVENYTSALRAGANLTTVHAMVDAINKIREVKGGSEFEPYSDFDITAHQGNIIGNVAKVLISDRTAAQEAAAERGEEVIPIWFDTEEAYNDLNDFAAQ